MVARTLALAVAPGTQTMVAAASVAVGNHNLNGPVDPAPSALRQLLVTVSLAVRLPCRAAALPWRCSLLVTSRCCGTHDSGSQ